MTHTSHGVSHNDLHDDNRITFWYQEPWVWFILGIIAVTFAWGAVQVTTAFNHADEVVVDDYYKVGKAINQDLTRDKKARELGIKSQIEFQSASNKVFVSINGSVENWPQQLRLRMLPAAPAAEKQTIALIQSPASPSNYSGLFSSLPDGRYFVQLETLDVMVPEEGYQGGWRLNREVIFAPDEVVKMSAYE